MYRNCWQPRWFLLGGGVLSYYDSREDAWKGCKGSIQMAVCEIQVKGDCPVASLTLLILVHSADNTRMDLIIPGEQYFYLKARNAAERQKWLVALGTAKACLTDIRTQKEKGKCFPSGGFVFIVRLSILSQFTESTETLKTKMAELRLYCDLLVQQVNKTKETGLPGGSESENGIDMGALLKSTCTTFLKTLDECMQIANSAFSSDLLYCAPSGSPPLTVPKSNKLRSPSILRHSTSERQMEPKNCENGCIYASTSLHEQLLVNSFTPAHLSTELNCEENNEENLPGDSSKDGETKLLPNEDNRDNRSLELVVDSLNKSTLLPQKEETDEDFPTFFSAMGNRFSDIDLFEDGGIPTEEFLLSCYAIVPVLDKLGPTVFAPVKMDFVGNIKKINQKYITNKDEFNTLQKIILHEVHNEVAQIRNSATEALLWLKRGLKFLKEFLTELKNGEKNIQSALNNAYGRTLRQHHGWVVRGVFAVSLTAQFY
ncbi:hypothetical protein lerEdw1_020272 [Lerista edwardsae]|nr:hypothetical protein lerEdw1_020272 [Lerista edwardsae]